MVREIVLSFHFCDRFTNYPYWISRDKFSRAALHCGLKFIGFGKNLFTKKQISIYVLIAMELNERIAEGHKNLVSDKHSKTGIVLQMPTVHPLLCKWPKTPKTRQV